MPRHEPSTRETGEPAPDNKVVMRRDADGNLVPVLPPIRMKETTEAKPKPQQADDPRSAQMRNVPPHGVG